MTVNPPPNTRALALSLARTHTHTRTHANAHARKKKPEKIETSTELSKWQIQNILAYHPFLMKEERGVQRRSILFVHKGKKQVLSAFKED